LPTGMSSVFVYYSTAVYYTHEVKERPSLHTDSTSYMMFYPFHDTLVSRT
jgi:hypothetical protein